MKDEEEKKTCSNNDKNQNKDLKGLYVSVPCPPLDILQNFTNTGSLSLNTNHFALSKTYCPCLLCPAFLSVCICVLNICFVLCDE